MKYLQEKLVSLLGGFGSIICYFIYFGIVVTPLTVIGLPPLACTLIPIAVILLPVLGGFITLAAYIWAFILIVQQPITNLSIFFYVFLALYFLLTILPAIISKK